MSRQRSSSAHARSFVAGIVVVLIAMWAGPAPADAAPLTLRVNGTADLTPFGGTPSAAFRGTVTWDPSSQSDSACYWFFCVDGSADGVSATVAIEGIDYSDRIRLDSRLLVFDFGLSLDLFFLPPIDLDAGPAPDLRYFGLNVWSAAGYPQPILEPGVLPDDFSFLGRAPRRFAGFNECAWWGCEPDEVMVGADTLTVVPEPAPVSLLLAGLLSFAISARARRA